MDSAPSGPRLPLRLPRPLGVVAEAEGVAEEAEAEEAEAEGVVVAEGEAEEAG